MVVRIKFLGGVKTVTGTSHLVSTDKSNVLFDAGLFQGRRDEFYRQNTALNFNPRKLNAMILSHAHIDHCGNIPVLLKGGMRCKIYTTSATKDLAKLMLEDSGKIHEEDVKYVNKINRRLGFPPRKPLYTRKEAGLAGKRFYSLTYGEKFCVANNVFVTLMDAGHILGSAVVVMDIREGEENLRIGFAVDLGRKDLALLNNPVIPEGLDYLVIESTYGGRFHIPVDEGKAKLKDAIIRTVNRNGKVLIPAFTLERTQEVLYFLSELFREKAIPFVPVYLDSPLATNITDVFKYNLSYFNPRIQQEIKNGQSPFELLNLTYIRDQKESKALNHDKRPMIIIAGCGMCESGRIVHHLQNNISDSRNTILVVGYMAENTLGKKIVNRVPFVRIFGVEYQLNAEVVIINAFSGHADKDELVDFVKKVNPRRRTFLVHGDIVQIQALYDTLIQEGFNVYIPSKEEELLLN
ncbi:MAG: MBL fold metallo-hydrolase [Candidatus Omnitrophota bacterium]|nr:MBL fold metallo-hydrolase [Candidatus Omnitrophota bacterium]